MNIQLADWKLCFFFFLVTLVSLKGYHLMAEFKSMKTVFGSGFGIYIDNTLG